MMPKVCQRYNLSLKGKYGLNTCIHIHMEDVQRGMQIWIRRYMIIGIKIDSNYTKHNKAWTLTIKHEINRYHH